jgi:hypothetical protein
MFQTQYGPGTSSSSHQKEYEVPFEKVLFVVQFVGAR